MKIHSYCFDNCKHYTDGTCVRYGLKVEPFQKQPKINRADRNLVGPAKVHKHPIEDPKRYFQGLTNSELSYIVRRYGCHNQEEAMELANRWIKKRELSVERRERLISLVNDCYIRKLEEE